MSELTDEMYIALALLVSLLASLATSHWFPFGMVAVWAIGYNAWIRKRRR